MDSTDEASPVKSFINMKREVMFNIIKQCNDRKMDKKFDFLETKLVEITKCPEDKIQLLRDSLKSFKHYYKLKWISASYKESRFQKSNEQWLQDTVAVPTWTLPKAGRPSKEFPECSERTKRRKTKHVRTEVPHDELTYAARMSERAAGNKDLATLIKDASVTPTRASKYRKIINTAEKFKVNEKLSATNALAKFIEADLSRKQYNVIRDGQEKIFPCYSLLQVEKKNSYPKDIFVSETLAEVKLQNLLDHTTQRLSQYLEEVLMRASELEMQNMELFCKWGCDGSKQHEYKQKFENISDSDAHVFISSLVPLRLISNVNGTSKIWWQNLVPSSPRFCRPIRIQYVHENKDVTQAEIKHIENQVQHLLPTDVEVNWSAVKVKVKHTLMPTMVDGKVCNAATDTTSTMRCYICKQTSTEFNSLKIVDESSIDPNTLRFGLSILHARIRLFETVLHLSYKLPIKKWRTNKQEKEIINERKRKIQEEFRSEMSLFVDVPKAGFGNTNDGNTSRKFFSEPEVAARITGVDIDLIKRFKTILEVLSSGIKIDTVKFSTFLRETAEHYVGLYGWHPMTPTLHKILAHGALVIDHVLLPIGQLSEEAAEARNKHFRFYREKLARKFCRRACNEDVMNRLLLTSDPFISSCRIKIHNKQRKSFSREALEFFIPDESWSINSGENEDDGGHDSDF